LDAGFNEVKMWFQAGNWLYRNGKELVEKFLPGNNEAYSKEKEVCDEIERIFDQKYKETNNTFEILIIIAYKD